MPFKKYLSIIRYMFHQFTMFARILCFIESTNSRAKDMDINLLHGDRCAKQNALRNKRIESTRTIESIERDRNEWMQKPR